MTDKQIIIYKKECYNEPHCSLNKVLEQFKRKEQECESLRNLLAEHNDVMKINELMMKEFGIEILKDITTGDITLRSIKLIELKQDCEELKNKLARSLTDKREKEIIIDQLKAENEELTTINARLLGRLEVDETDTSLVFNLDKELRQKEKEFYTAIQKVVKLKQTLSEIKKIAENGKRFAERYMITGEQKSNVLTYANAILNKISEVDDESYLDNHWLFTENKKGEN